MTTRPGRDRFTAHPAPAGPIPPPDIAADAGMVTAEFAVALPAFVLILMAALFAVSAVLAQLRCEDAAAAAARMAARGDPTAELRTVALTDAPGAARLSLSTSTAYVTATVSATVLPLGGLGLLPGVTVQAHVVEPREDVAGALG